MDGCRGEGERGREREREGERESAHISCTSLYYRPHHLYESESVCGHPLSCGGGGGQEANEGLVHLALVVRVALQREERWIQVRDSTCMGSGSQ